MTKSKPTQELLLTGLDGRNPLGFLAAVGTAIVAKDIFPETRLGWKLTPGGWRPSIQGCGEDEQEFSCRLFKTLRDTSMTVFKIDKKMPFEASKLSDEFQTAQYRSSITSRRDADMLVSFGTELYPNKENNFQDSQFRMVRTGDSAGQGLPFYARKIREKTTQNHIQRALFHTWDYQDTDVPYSLRWDPIEDQRYALRWYNPSNKKSNGMIGANSLAIEALRCFPTLLIGKKAQTTGFNRLDRLKTYFVWPIWIPVVGIETLRSMLALPDLYRDPLPHLELDQRGIAEVYGSERIQPNRYYSNFAPARPL